MKDHTELKGGIVPLLLSLVVGQAVDSLIGQKLSDREQAEKNRTEWAAREKTKADNEARKKQAQNDAIAAYNEEQSIRRIEQDAMSKIYMKQAELQKKAAVEDVKRASQRVTNQKQIEQSKNQLQTAKELQQQEFNLQKRALESHRQTANQEQAAINKARFEGIKQKAIADVRKQFAAPVITRRLPPSVSTALLTKRGRGYDNDLLAMLQSYYGISLKEAKKLYKSHF
jgi:hypothetical protein